MVLDWKVGYQANYPVPYTVLLAPTLILGLTLAARCPRCPSVVTHEASSCCDCMSDRGRGGCGVSTQR